MTQSNANDRQVGGNHYQGREYQHWDFVTDVKLPYLLGCATKYVSRWRDKNGVQDLEKAIHYIDKAKEREVFYKGGKMIRVRRFAAQHPDKEKFIIRAICEGAYEDAKFAIGLLISESAPEKPTQESQG